MTRLVSGLHAVTAYMITFAGIKSSNKAQLTISRLLKINISVAKGSTSYHIATNANGKNRTSGRKFFKQHGLCNIGVQISDIKGGHGIIWRTRIHFGMLFDIAVLRRHQTKRRQRQLHFLFTMTIAFLRPRCTLTYTNLKSSDSRLFFIILQFFWILCILCFFFYFTRIFHEILRIV